MNISFHIAEYGSELHNQSVDLRAKVLREPLGIKFSLEELANEKDQSHMVGVDNSEVVAVSLLKKIDDVTAKLRQFAVHPLHQGKGIGKMLVRFFEKEATKSQFEVVELHARKEAMLFYQKMGYQIVGDQFEEVGIPHYKMIKKLE